MSRQRREVSPAQVRKICERYDAGVGMKIIGDVHGFNVVVIRRVLIEHGKTIRKVGRPLK